MFAKQLLMIMLVSMSIIFPVTLENSFNDCFLTTTGDYEYSDIAYTYGFATGESLFERDGFLQITSQDETITIFFDSGGNEYAIFMAVLAKNIAVVYERYVTDENSEDVFLGISIVTYSFSGNLQGRLDYRDKPVGYGNRNFLLMIKWENGKIDNINSYLALCYEPDISGHYEELFCLQFQGMARINDIYSETIEIHTPGNYEITLEDDLGLKTFDIVVDPLITGIENEKTYTNEVTIFSQGDLYLDDSPFVSGTSIVEAGIHSLTVLGEGGYKQTWIFSIAILLENVYDGMETINPVRILSNATDLTINGEKYEGNLITKAGRYTLKAIGTGGMEKTFSFSILPALSGADDKATYNNAVEIWTNCDFLVNGEKNSEHCLIENEGGYEIVLLMEGAEYARLSFSIENDVAVSGIFSNPIFWTSILVVVAVVGLVIIYKKK